MINTSLRTHFTMRQFDIRCEKPASKGVLSQRDELFSARQAPKSTQAVDSTRSISPMQQFTRINGHTIPRVDWQPWNYPVFSPVHCTAHLSHEEWLATLSPDVLWRLSLHHDDEYISNLDSAGRFYFSCGVRLQDIKDMFGYIDRVSQAMMELGESMGMEWVGSRGSYYPHDVLIASFKCPNGGPDRIVTIFADGTKLFTDVPPGFAHDGFNDFANDILNELMQSLDNSNASVARLRAFFEERFF